MVNDVRRQPRLSLPFEYLMALRYSERLDTRPCGVVNFDRRLAEGGNYLVPPQNNYSVTWFAHQWPVSGRLRLGRIHAHPSMPIRNMIFSTPPEVLGLSMNSPIDRPLTTALPATEYAHVENRLRRQDTLQCWQDPNEDQLDYVYGRYVHRFRMTRCREWDFKRADVLTIVSMTPRLLHCCGTRNMAFFTALYDSDDDAPRIFPPAWSVGLFD